MVRVALVILAVLVAAAVLIRWFNAGEAGTSWIHPAGLGLTVALLIFAFYAEKGRQPTRPPD